jgi:NodT family efflux transporter outer membrane factor (OMF) lipoprotein
MSHIAPYSPNSRLAACLILFALAGCATGPDFVRPAPAAPEDWTSWRSADESLRAPLAQGAALQGKWWLAFGDPVLDRLQERALKASPDLRTALLRFEQARVQRITVAAQGGPELAAGASAQRQRQSEYGAGTRMIDAIGGDRERLAGVLSAPFTLGQAGFDASWEPDLWGRVRRSVEAADADLARQAALLDLARLSVAGELARHYLELRTSQRQVVLLREDAAALEERLAIQEARVRGGAIDHADLSRQRAELAAARAQLPAMLEQEGASANQIALLLGAQPGALRLELAAQPGRGRAPLPDLALGLPSELALRRPDIRAAQARLHRATASIGVARADLYPSVRIGARIGVESYQSGEFADWGSRMWSVGPSFTLPLFDRGRRKGMVALRELEQQEAAVNYQQTVLKAWQEIDDALSAYAAQQQQSAQLAKRVADASEAYELARARHAGGGADFLAVLDSRRGYLQASRDLALSEGRLDSRFVAINKALGNVSFEGNAK